jgi:RNA polymerase sigma factor (sigma-70 family)
MPIPPNNTNKPDGVFLTTRWSRVVLAGATDEKDAHQALSELCRDYWQPLYFFARRRGYQTEDAQDLTQGFIAELLANNTIARAQQERGRFRTFLLGSFNHHIANWVRHHATQKRGGGAVPFSIDSEAAEATFAQATADNNTPETHFERKWALSLLDKVMNQLGEEYRNAGREALFTAMHPHLAGGGPRPGYANIAAELAFTENALTVAIHRMRKRYGTLLRAEIAATLADESEIEDELRHLMKVLAG